MLWLARDGNDDAGNARCTLFRHRPKWEIDMWVCSDSPTSEFMLLAPPETPIKLKPGEGPVKVVLRLAEKGK